MIVRTQVLGRVAAGPGYLIRFAQQKVQQPEAVVLHSPRKQSRVSTAIRQARIQSEIGHLLEISRIPKAGIMVGHQTFRKILRR